MLYFILHTITIHNVWKSALYVRNPCAYQGGEETVARWEESKKWQKTVERLKGRLRDKDTELEKVAKASEMLKHALERSVEYHSEVFR